MIANLLIGLREGLEAALVVSILIAYLVRSDRRHLIPRIWVGVALAIAVSLGFGALLTFGPADLAESSQELIAGTLSVLAVVFVTWMIFWMAGAARGMGAELRSKVDAAAARGGMALVLTALLAVGREGLETALFIWAATRRPRRPAARSGRPCSGLWSGLCLAALIGYLIYRGALRVNLTAFFKWTGAFLILVAAGVLSYARPRPAGGRAAARRGHAPVRRVGRRARGQLVRHAAQGRVQLLRRHDRAPGDRLARLRGARDDAVLAQGRPVITGPRRPAPAAAGRADPGRLGNCPRAAGRPGRRRRRTAPRRPSRSRIGWTAEPGPSPRTITLSIASLR